MTPAQMLADAQAKLHLLYTGRLSVEVVVDGRTVRYSRANIADLKSWIAELRDIVNGRPHTAGAIGITF